MLKKIIYNKIKTITVSKTHKMTVTMIAIIIINKIIIKVFIKIKTIYHFSLIFSVFLNHFHISLFYLFNNINSFYIRMFSCMLIISLLKIIMKMLYYFCSLQDSHFKLHLKIIKTEFISCLQDSSTISIYNDFHKINFNLEFSKSIKIRKMMNSLQIIMKLHTTKNTINLIILILFMSLRTIKNKMKI